MAAAVTVAIPVLNGGPLLLEVLAAVNAQRLDRDVELLVCDSGSTDGSAEAAERAGARVLRIARGEFSHGGTRNLLAAEARGEHVAFLTQDATPAHDGWLAALLGGFELADDVALVTGPYLPRPDAPLPVRRELTEMFDALAGGPRVYRLADAGEPPRPGLATYHSDADGALAKGVWREVPFRAVPYAEDQLLALDVLRAGYAKAFVPEAAVLHSHRYGALEQMRRHYDEFRALREVFGHVADAHPRRLAGHVRAQVRADRRYARERGFGAESWRSLVYHAGRAVTAAAGSRSRWPGV
ncbi:glycosyltransferase family 2 protein [Candidatus Solirubrobacter pratensis]|uniref:glycosyltransferase family 2 protein n=1 Tax=Candidatus Solirubrobacter pratensis TaxID=1298857 RepID=UPI000429044F|nr:glycosyltransferase family 2 protein [Candidatus Solirubrobacter pratensis]